MIFEVSKRVVRMRRFLQQLTRSVSVWGNRRRRRVEPGLWQQGELLQSRELLTTFSATFEHTNDKCREVDSTTTIANPALPDDQASFVISATPVSVTLPFTVNGQVVDIPEDQTNDQDCSFLMNGNGGNENTEQRLGEVDLNNGDRMELWNDTAFWQDPMAVNVGSQTFATVTRIAFARNVDPNNPANPNGDWRQYATFTSDGWGRLIPLPAADGTASEFNGSFVAGNTVEVESPNGDMRHLAQIETLTVAIDGTGLVADHERPGSTHYSLMSTSAERTDLGVQFSGFESDEPLVLKSQNGPHGDSTSDMNLVVTRSEDGSVGSGHIRDLAGTTVSSLTGLAQAKTAVTDHNTLGANMSVRIADSVSIGNTEVFEIEEADTPLEKIFRAKASPGLLINPNHAENTVWIRNSSVEITTPAVQHPGLYAVFLDFSRDSADADPSTVTVRTAQKTIGSFDAYDTLLPGTPDTAGAAWADIQPQFIGTTVYLPTDTDTKTFIDVAGPEQDEGINADTLTRVFVRPATPPQMSNIVSFMPYSGTPAGPISFTVTDAETPDEDLQVTVQSLDETLLPPSDISITGSGTSRQLTLTPAAMQTGTGQIVLTVTDEDGMTATQTITVNVQQPEIPDRVVLNGPDGDVTGLRPEISWQSVSHAVRYEVWVNQGGTPRVIHLTNVQSTTLTPDFDLDVGATFKWWVRAFNGDGQDGQWSEPLQFTVTGQTPRPGKPVLTGPVGDVTGTRPGFSWDAVPNADRYELWVNQGSQSRVIHFSDLQDTTFTPDSDLSTGRNYTWWVRAFNADGVAGQWSPGVRFTMTGQSQRPGHVVLSGPFDDVNSRRPEFSWQADANADRYEIWVNEGSLARIIHQTNVRTTTLTPDFDLVIGATYKWWVRAFNSDNTAGPWSGPGQFTVTEESPRPGIPQPARPTGDYNELRPEFMWFPAQHAHRYELWVNGGSTSRVIHETDLQDTTFTPDFDLVVGQTYTWWVRALSLTGVTGTWSDPLRFTIVDPQII